MSETNSSTVVATKANKPKVSLDIGTMIGIVLGIACIVVSIQLSGELGAFYDLPSIFVVIGGTIASLLISFRLGEIAKIMKVAIKTFSNTSTPPDDTVNLIVHLANVARREGLLALDVEKDTIENQFMRRLLEQVVDGFDPETVQQTGELELDNLRGRHERGQSMFKFLGTIFPAWGMIGTLIGLVLLLGQLDDPSKIGPAMAVALITTFYGSVMANFLCIPMANKLALHSEAEVNHKLMVLEGILSIQNGENPRIIEQKLMAFLSPEQRKAYEKAQAAGTGSSEKSVTG